MSFESNETRKVNKAKLCPFFFKLKNGYQTSTLNFKLFCSFGKGNEGKQLPKCTIFSLVASKELNLQATCCPPCPHINGKFDCHRPISCVCHVWRLSGNQVSTPRSTTLQPSTITAEKKLIRISRYQSSPPCKTHNPLQSFLLKPLHNFKEWIGSRHSIGFLTTEEPFFLAAVILILIASSMTQ